ncbi:glutamate 5-kinase [Propionibacterium sp. oral taxon 192 str. F0372]|uniref:glutamate 5-kinase n=1 Tax=Propionibacterium sp. oral taxon 192 TaxID=671222 RepID=UPI00035292BF|nr:glutamate 5-kinase [Propionibacterium sp. oral taxon 192]EPH06996.1 glutamate 5-kinase [Propionibacterium sp. oral taxon 192 str. F0372]
MSEEEIWLAEPDVRAAVRDARRIVVKVGSSSLSAETGGLDEEKLSRLVDALADFHDGGRDVVLVTSGAIAAGLKPLGLRRRPRDLAHQQAAAAVGQGVLMQHYADRFHARGILAAQLLLTVEDVTRQETYANALRSLGTLLKMGAVPVVNENDAVATHEIRFGDNDRLAALVAQLVRADALVLLSDVECLYTAHPDEPDSEPISHVADVEELTVDTHRVGSAIGTGGMTTKLQAAQIATAAGIPVVLANAARLTDVLGGQSTGTTFSPIDRRRPRRLLWLAHASVARGSLHVDQGAVRALTERNASLLAAGIRRVEGTFVAGDPVDIITPDGKAIVRGLVSFSSVDLPAMLGRRSREMADDLGAGFERAVVHRDVMVALDHSL